MQKACRRAVLPIGVSLLIFWPTFVFSWFNIGLGYYFGDQNNFLLRVGYEQADSVAFSLNGEYVINNGWVLSSKLAFKVSNFRVGPFVYLTFMQPGNEPKFSFGGLLEVLLSQHLEATVGMIYGEDTPIGKLLFASLRFYAPEPPGMKMTDKLYFELGYRMGAFVLSVGLLEPW
ncbi:hypothetical protein [Fervidobacterium thailandense]|uniref:Uncharacterized protein n=1 Tax=Fervidobacterium thailandense TaxID=1008305 RepID=A0A1E3G0E2_9BACT|nr:hypothetical protein [Fervidobacterium thailandense]ODN29746.1 hypothetical protein A4H02_09210 [Fervidobacterium thailandense]